MRCAVAVLITTIGCCNAGRPNILLVISDQTRPDALSFFGGPAVTPNLDRIAAEGAVFKNAFSSTPICTPARAALLHGRSPWRHGMRGYFDSVAPDTYTTWLQIPEVLREAGYYTGVAGKNHYGYNTTSGTFYHHGYQNARLYEGERFEDPYSADFALIDTYDAFFNASCPGCDPVATEPAGLWNAWFGAPYIYDECLHPTAWTATAALEFLRDWRLTSANTTGAAESTTDNAAASSAAPQPFFLALSFHRPHSPYDPPQRWFDTMMTKVADFPPPFNGSAADPAAWDQVYAWSPLCNATRVDCGNGCGAESYCGGVDTDEYINSRALYYGSLSFVDEQFGRVLRDLERTDVLDSTWVVYSSDHGDALGDHSLWRKATPFQQVASVPFFVRWPSSVVGLDFGPRGTALDFVIEIRDIFPTLADAAGVDISGWGPNATDSDFPDGESIIPLLLAPSVLSESPRWRGYIDLGVGDCVGELNADGEGTGMNWNALTDGRIKYIYYFLTGAEHLFDLDADPTELTSLTSDPAFAGTLALWRSRLVAQFQSEGRGEMWVTADGALATISQSSCAASKLTDNYPCFPDECSNT